MFCFIHLPYHANSTVLIQKSKSTQNVEKRFLFEFYQMRRPSEDVREKIDQNGFMLRRLLYRRSHSEPVKKSSSDENIVSSRTDPEWSMTIDSISLQSSYADYQKRRKMRFRKQKQQKKSTNTTTSSNSDLMKIDSMNQLNLKFETDSSFSDEITSSMAKEISYEEEIRNFVENIVMEPISNIFADPFESDERRSRIEQWVDTVTPTRKTSEEENVGRKEFEKQNTEESVVSSRVSQRSVVKTIFKQNLQEAIETQSQIDVKDVDKFWDYLYDKNLETQITTPKSIEIGDRSHLENTRAIENSSTSSMSEKNREIDEVEERPENYFTVQQISKTRDFSSQTSHRPMSLKNYDRISQLHFSQMFNNLKILLVERDRARIGLERLPNRILKELSEKSNYSQARYRLTMEQNKERLDRRIDEIWRKLRKMSIDDFEIRDFINVSNSDQLTLHATRNIPL